MHTKGNTNAMISLKKNENYNDTSDNTSNKNMGNFESNKAAAIDNVESHSKLNKNNNSNHCLSNIVATKIEKNESLNSNINDNDVLNINNTNNKSSYNKNNKKNEIVCFFLSSFYFRKE